MHALTDTWHINNRINLYLLDALTDEQLTAVSASKGRNVGEQFAHLHNVRLMWLKVAAAPLWEGLAKLEKGNPLTKVLLTEALVQSGEAIAQLLEDGMATGKIKGFKPHPTAFAGYLLAHEAHHRGQVMMTLKQAGHKVDPKIAFGLWEWGSR
ncbi:DinB family protein [Flavobacterium sp. XGLA_31]|uniref:DinB family protein n=1 Tax=Flavobacterium sp. XGLA_31 TaxID=3447666 RepID=UPI003F3CFFFD